MEAAWTTHQHFYPGPRQGAQRLFSPQPGKNNHKCDVMLMSLLENILTTAELSLKISCDCQTSKKCDADINFNEGL